LVKKSLLGPTPVSFIALLIDSSLSHPRGPEAWIRYFRNTTLTVSIDNLIDYMKESGAMKSRK